MPPQFKSNKRPGELVWISEHVLSFTERTAPSRTPFMKKRKGKKRGKKHADLLCSTVHFSIWCCRQIGYGKLLNPSSLSPPLTGSRLYGSCRSRALGLCSCENQSRWGTRNELSISGNFKPKAPRAHRLLTYSRSCIWSRRLRHNFFKKKTFAQVSTSGDTSHASF